VFFQFVPIIIVVLFIIGIYLGILCLHLCTKARNKKLELELYSKEYSRGDLPPVVAPVVSWPYSDTIYELGSCKGSRLSN
jgi:hypothetical protein